MNTVKIAIMSLVWKVRSTTQNDCWKVILKLHVKSEFDLLLKNEKKERKRKKYKPDGNIFVSKSIIT